MSFDDEFKKFQTSIDSTRKNNEDRFKLQKLNLQIYSNTKDVNFLYSLFASLMSDNKYFNDSILLIEEKMFKVIYHVLTLQNRTTNY